ncbi:MAG: mechanosensitive ion channel family protein, partial [Cycloclasticus sp.]
MNKVLLIFLLIFHSTLSFADNSTDTTSTNEEPIVSPAALGLSSPRETFATFLHSMNDIKRGQPGRINKATSTLDLSAINPLIREEKGRDLAW